MHFMAGASCAFAVRVLVRAGIRHSCCVKGRYIANKGFASPNPARQLPFERKTIRAGPPLKEESARLAQEDVSLDPGEPEHPSRIDCP
jgi:hypothetical protein